ncbi:MAG: ZIP family metal transporter [Betaproteobacteria bacterium]|nr:ZIP family metal transporter [Betaproteobacteria bacterium]MDH3437001.1 ZIP family metal transporter [Betaproteobacteria bacterium]
MTTLAWIGAATVAGGVLSVAAAGALALRARAAHIPVLISYAVGALLGAVFLELLPHAFRLTDSPERMAGTILVGILVFFVLEKLVLWRHCHVEECEAHDPPAFLHDHGRSGAMIMIGDTFHNFVDGILIAAAFMANHELGIVTAMAIIAHEIPQEIGDFLILLHSGYTKNQALLLNVLSSAAMVAGGLIAYFALQTLQQWVAPLLGLAAASMLYVAVADLIPGLHRRPELGATAQQVVLIALGVMTIWLVGEIAHSAA